MVGRAEPCPVAKKCGRREAEAEKERTGRISPFQLNHACRRSTRATLNHVFVESGAPVAACASRSATSPSAAKAHWCAAQEPAASHRCAVRDPAAAASTQLVVLRSAALLQEVLL